MRLSLGISPCPNDTFIFDALIHGRIDTEGLAFDLIMADVEELNRRAFQHSIHVTKLSFHAFAWVATHYSLLNSGSALGRKNGPLLISKEVLSPETLRNCRIAIPGKYTTANLLFSLFYPGAEQKKEMLFSTIEDALLSGDADAGIIIHENRFTYQSKGLVMIADLGERWESLTGHPIPLGGIAIDLSLPLNIQAKMDRVLRRSVEYALTNPGLSADFVRDHARELDREVIMKHIGLYVNDYTVDLGETGREAIRLLFRMAKETIPFPEVPEHFFVGVKKNPEDGQ